ncbi:MAG: biopolymer transporter ExbD [Gammaproteobacteria bacterium]|nr:biopolymer transporter ExbD [Gammaproteobacteria bacterium]NVK88277.1 biopolymer transporter ExbD [Gammaproteobacteria bacterium]
MFRKRAKRTRELNTELNITAFMNLMVVLVPFLLITAVFSQVSILDLNLPGTGAAQEQLMEEPPKALEVIVRKDRLELVERASGSLRAVPNVEDGYDFKTLNEILQQVKSQDDFKDETTITLLLEEDIEYDVLIQTMDAVRLMKQESSDDQGKVIVYNELFPDISIGSAPPDADATEKQP